jgi:acid stress chaperone HdeB
MKRQRLLSAFIKAPSAPQPRWSALIPLSVPKRPPPLGGLFHDQDKCMPRLFITIAISLLLGQMPARAEDNMVVDMSKLTCAELNRLGFQDFAGITMWMSGYYNAGVRNTVVDLDRFAQAAKAVKDHCATTPRATVMSAAERALGIKMPRGRQ